MKQLALFLFLALTLTSMAQEKNMTDFKVEIKDVEDIHMVYYEYTGPYQKSFNDFGNLMAYLGKNNIPLGAYSLGIFYDDPATVPENELRSEAGYSVQKAVNVTEGYKFKTIPASKALSVRYNSVEEIMLAYGALSEYIAEHKIKTKPFSLEIYHSYEKNYLDAEILFLVEE